MIQQQTADQKTASIAENVQSQNDTINQFGVAQVPFHQHTGGDSPTVSYTNLTNRTDAFQFVLPGTSAATAGNYGTIFIAPYKCIFLGASEVHQTAGNDSSPVFVQIEKLTGTTASGSGTALLAYNITAVAVAAGGISYAVGDTITLTGGTGTKAILTVTKVSGGVLSSVSINSRGAYTAFPANPISQGSSSGSGTGATFNLTFSDGFNMKGTANTVQNGLLSPIAPPNFGLAKGDRLGLVLLGTPTSIANAVFAFRVQII